MNTRFSTPEPQERLVVAAGLPWLAPTRLLLQRRPPTARHGAGKLEFVGGKIERTESPAKALHRELLEEWGERASCLRVGPVADVLHHLYPPPGPEVLLVVMHVDASAWVSSWQARIVLEPGARAEAYELGGLPLDDFLEADRPFAARVAQGEVRCPASFAKHSD